MAPKISPVLASKKASFDLQFPDDSSFDRPTSLKKVFSPQDVKSPLVDKADHSKQSDNVCENPIKPVVDEPPLSFKYGRHKVKKTNF